MRNFIFTFIVAISTFTAVFAQDRDTIATFKLDKDEKVTLRQDEKNRAVTIDIAGYEIMFGEHKGVGAESILKTKVKCPRAKLTILSDNSIGFTTLISSDNGYDSVLDLNQGKSIFFSSNLFGISAPLDPKRVVTFKTALNLRCFNFTFDDNITIDYQDGEIVTLDIDESNKKSKLTTAYLGIPFSLSIKLNNRCFIEPIIYAGINFNAHTKYKRPTVKDDDLNCINPIISGTMLRFMYKNIGLFADYSFTNIFKNNLDLKAKAFSFGLTLSL